MSFESQPIENNTIPFPSDEAKEEAFVSLVTHHQTAILAFLLAIIPSPSDAEDLLQRANIVLWRKRAQFVPGTNFKAWAFSIARWEALALLKERKRGDWLVFSDDLAGLIGDRLSSVPDAGFDFHPEALRKCLGSLSPKNRRLILDRYQTGHTVKDCARRYGRSESGLRVTLHRIRIALRRCINQQRQIDPDLT